MSSVYKRRQKSFTKHLQRTFRSFTVFYKRLNRCVAANIKRIVRTYRRIYGISNYQMFQVEFVYKLFPLLLKILIKL